MLQSQSRLNIQKLSNRTYQPMPDSQLKKNAGRMNPLARIPSERNNQKRKDENAEERMIISFELLLELVVDG